MDDQALCPPEDSHFDTSLVGPVQMHGKARAVGVTEPAGQPARYGTASFCVKPTLRRMSDFAPFLSGLGTESLIGSNIGKVTSAFFSTHSRAMLRLLRKAMGNRLTLEAGKEWLPIPKRYQARHLGGPADRL
jgi:hypothetical protein